MPQLLEKYIGRGWVLYLVTEQLNKDVELEVRSG